MNESKKVFSVFYTASLLIVLILGASIRLLFESLNKQLYTNAIGIMIYILLLLFTLYFTVNKTMKHLNIIITTTLNKKKQETA